MMTNAVLSCGKTAFVFTKDDNSSEKGVAYERSKNQN
jgi:hypothetical protein